MQTQRHCALGNLPLGIALLVVSGSTTKVIYYILYTVCRGYMVIPTSWRRSPCLGAGQKPGHPWPENATPCQHKVRRTFWGFLKIGLPPNHPRHPICSMYRIFTYIYPKNHPNVGKSSRHGAYGHGWSFLVLKPMMTFGTPIGLDSPIYLKSISWPKLMSQGICWWPPRYNWSFKPAHVHCLDPIFCLVKSVS